MISKSPLVQGNYIHPVIFFPSARKAFNKILTNIDFSKGKLLLPAYIGVTEREGSGVFDPVYETQTPFEFYPLDRKLAPNSEALIKIIRENNISAILFIHYFGFCQDGVEKLIDFCRENEVIVIEDCAHTLGNNTLLNSIGTMGDFSLYALHKVLPVKVGAMLKINNPDFKYLTQKIEHSIPIESVISFSLSDYEEINNKKRANYFSFLKKMDEISGISLLYSCLPDEIVPHNFPFIVQNELREKLYFNLIKRKVPIVSLYYRMIPEIHKSDFPDTYYISENILNLPVHQDIKEQDIQLMVHHLKEALLDVGE